MRLPRVTHHAVACAKGERAGHEGRSQDSRRLRPAPRRAPCSRGSWSLAPACAPGDGQRLARPARLRQRSLSPKRKQMRVAGLEMAAPNTPPLPRAALPSEQKPRERLRWRVSVQPLGWVDAGLRVPSLRVSWALCGSLSGCQGLAWTVRGRGFGRRGAPRPPCCACGEAATAHRLRAGARKALSPHKFAELRRPWTHSRPTARSPYSWRGREPCSSASLRRSSLVA